MKRVIFIIDGKIHILTLTPKKSKTMTTKPENKVTQVWRRETIGSKSLLNTPSNNTCCWYDEDILGECDIPNFDDETLPKKETMHTFRGSLWFLTILVEAIQEEPYETLDESHMDNLDRPSLENKSIE